MESEIKDLGLLQYQNKFKNRGNEEKRRNGPKRPFGNTLSLGGARGVAGQCRSRITEKSLNHDVEIHQVIDYKPLSVSYQYRKNNLPSSVTLSNSPQMNQQNTSELVIKKNNKDTNLVRFIHLPEINPNLYLSNGDIFDSPETLKELNINTILNLSTHWKHKQSQYQYPVIFNPSYNDTRQLTFKEFKDIIEITQEIIINSTSMPESHQPNAPLKLVNNRPLLVLCDKGVNRSVSVIIAYAIIEKGWTFDQAIDYIDTIKLEKYPFWNSLTNPRIKNLLKALGSQHHIKQAIKDPSA